MATGQQVHDFTIPRWPLGRFTDEDIAVHGPFSDPSTLTDGEMVGLKVLLIAWIRTNPDRDDLTREERWVNRVAASALAKIDLALDTFLPDTTDTDTDDTPAGPASA